MTRPLDPLQRAEKRVWGGTRPIAAHRVRPRDLAPGTGLVLYPERVSVLVVDRIGARVRVRLSCGYEFNAKIETLGIA